MKTKPCRYCHGTARITFRDSRGFTTEHECTSCNGTGIDGDPRILFWIMVVMGLLMVIGVGFAVSS